jgi:hypothetical protein
MITDRQNQVSSAQALTTGTIVSTDTIDLGVARDVGAGERLKLVINVDTVFAGGTSVQPQIITSAAANLGSPTVLASMPALTLAQLTAGASFVFPMPETNPQGRGQRYLGVQYVIVGTFSTGAVTSSFVVDAQHTGKQYATAFTVA